MDIEKRLSNLENLVDYLSKQIDRMRFYTDADTAGTRQSVSDITPYTDVKTAYIGDDDAHFFNVPQGMLSVSVVDSDGNFHNYYTVERENTTVSVYFDEPLESVATVTIMIQ